MKKQFLFLAVVACLSLSSVSVGASPPTDVGSQYEPTIKQTVAVQSQAIVAVTPNECSFEIVAVELMNETLLTDAKPQPMVQLVCPTSPIQSVDGLGVLSYDVAILDYNYLRILMTGFHYIEGTATEYSC